MNGGVAHFGILGRLLLIVLSAVLSLSAASLLLLRWQTTRHPRPAPFLRVEQFAADADLLATVPAGSRPFALRALGSSPLQLRIEDRAPDIGKFIHAPRLEAKMRGFARTPTGAAAQAYTSAGQAHRAPQDRVEGFMALAVAALPDGRFLSATPNLRPEGGPLLGAPTALWIGLSGAAVAALAVYGAIREMRPLRRLARSVDAFSGSASHAPLALRGAPEVQALAAAINAMQDRVSNLMRERTLTIGAVSHDLRTLLTRMQLRVLALDDPAPRARFTADLDAMSALIEDALAFARGVDPKLPRKPVDLADLAATEIAEREAVGAPLPIETALSDAPVVGDAAALRRVVANLIENAARFGRGRIRVTARDDGRHVLLRVEDDGPGVPPEDRERVLAPFYRVEGSRSRATGGAGLGLAIASRIVEAHGGRIAITASDLGGALAEVTLPRRPET